MAPARIWYQRSLNRRALPVMHRYRSVMRPASNRTLPVGSNTQRTWTTRSLMISSSYVKRLTYTHARSNNTPCARRARPRGLMVARSAHLSAWSAGVRRGRSEAAACERPGTSMWAGLGARWRGSRERRISRSGVLSRDRLEQSQGQLLITTDAAEGRGGLVYSYTISLNLRSHAQWTMRGSERWL